MKNLKKGCLDGKLLFLLTMFVLLTFRFNSRFVSLSQATCNRCLHLVTSRGARQYCASLSLSPMRLGPTLVKNEQSRSRPMVCVYVLLPPLFASLTFLITVAARLSLSNEISSR